MDSKERLLKRKVRTNMVKKTWKSLLTGILCTGLSIGTFFWASSLFTVDVKGATHEEEIAAAQAAAIAAREEALARAVANQQALALEACNAAATRNAIIISETLSAQITKQALEQQALYAAAVNQEALAREALNAQMSRELKILEETLSAQITKAALDEQARYAAEIRRLELEREMANAAAYLASLK